MTDWKGFSYSVLVEIVVGRDTLDLDKRNIMHERTEYEALVKASQNNK